MKAVLEFSLNEEGEQECFDITLKAMSYRGVLLDIDQFLRSEVKYGSNDLKVDIYESVREKLHELLLRYEITL